MSGRLRKLSTVLTKTCADPAHPQIAWRHISTPHRQGAWRSSQPGVSARKKPRAAAACMVLASATTHQLVWARRLRSAASFACLHVPVFSKIEASCERAVVGLISSNRAALSMLSPLARDCASRDSAAESPNTAFRASKVGAGSSLMSTMVRTSRSAHASPARYAKSGASPASLITTGEPSSCNLRRIPSRRIRRSAEFGLPSRLSTVELYATSVRAIGSSAVCR
jgi:hypothetical protein